MELPEDRASAKTKDICDVVREYLDTRFSTDNMKVLEGLKSNHWLKLSEMKTIVCRFPNGLAVNSNLVEMQMIKIKTSAVPPSPVSTPNIMKLISFKRSIAPTSHRAPLNGQLAQRIL